MGLKITNFAGSPLCIAPKGNLAKFHDLYDQNTPS